MLSFFFHQSSWFPRALSIVALAGFAVLEYNGRLCSNSPAVTWGQSIALGQLLFLYVCDLKSWYPQEQRKIHGAAGKVIGIEVHFRKITVIAAYTLSLSVLMTWLQVHWLLWLLFNLLIAILTMSNVIMISYHRRDRDPLPVNYVTRQLQKNDPEQLYES